MAATTLIQGYTSYLTVSNAKITPTKATADPTDKSKLRVTMSMTALIAARLTIDGLQREEHKIALSEERAARREVKEGPNCGQRWRWRLRFPKRDDAGKLHQIRADALSRRAASAADFWRADPVNHLWPSGEVPFH